MEKTFLVHIRRKGYKNILQIKKVVPDYDKYLSIVSNKNENKRKYKRRELDEDTYGYLLISITGDTEVGRVVFQFVCISKTEKFIDRDMHIACKILT